MFQGTRRLSRIFGKFPGKSFLSLTIGEGINWIYYRVFGKSDSFSVSSCPPIIQFPRSTYLEIYTCVRSRICVIFRWKKDFEHFAVSIYTGTDFNKLYEKYHSSNIEIHTGSRTICVLLSYEFQVLRFIVIRRLQRSTRSNVFFMSHGDATEKEKNGVATAKKNINLEKTNLWEVKKKVSQSKFHIIRITYFVSVILRGLCDWKSHFLGVTFERETPGT